MKKDLSTAVAAVVGSLPGFTLPFTAALVLAPRDSDLFLLAISVAITQAIIVSSAVELTTIAAFGRVLGRDETPDRAALRGFRRRVMGFAVLLTIVVTPLLTLAYASRSSDRTEFVVLVGVVMVTPLIAAWGSMLSGECVARGNPVPAVALQSMRSLLPALFLLAWWDVPLPILAASLPAGEALRGALLMVAARRGRARQAAAHTASELSAYGLTAQALSSGVTQLGPAVDRLYLSSSGAGYISSYEIADRLVYAAAQFFNLTFLYRRVGRWARLPTMREDEANELLVRDGRTLGWVVAVLTSGGIVGSVLCLASGLLPAAWEQGFLWGAIVMLSLPAHAFCVVGTRLLVVCRKQSMMLSIAVATAVLNAGLDALGYALFGPTGIVVATVVLRWIMAGVYAWILRTAVPQTVGQELA